MLGAVCYCLFLGCHAPGRILDALPLVPVVSVVTLKAAPALHQNGVLRILIIVFLGRLYNRLG